MTAMIRALTVGIATVATFYFVYWVPFSLIPGVSSVPWLPYLGSLLCAVAVGRYLWTQTAAVSSGFVSCVVVGAFGVGAIGFAGGFFGPLLLMPSANQGPLLGLFITGPLGFLLGGLGGAIYWLARGRASRSLPPGAPLA